MFSLREIQVDPVQAGINYLRGKSKKPSLLVAPTAFGKSIAIAHIAEDLKEGILVIQPSKELLEQNFGKFIAMGGEATVYSASFNQRKLGKVTYATIGTICSLGKLFKEYGYKYLIVDEVHLYPRTMDSMFGQFLEDSGLTKVLGLTATPFKLQNNVGEDGESYSKLVMLTSRSKHGNFFKEILHVTQISEMTSRNYWSKLEYLDYDFDTKKLRYNSTKAEYTEDSILKQYEEQQIGEKVVDCMATLEGRNSILVFVPSVEEAKRLAALTPSSGAIYSGMPTKEREHIISSFKAGRLRVIFNVNILSVGFDHPLVDCIVLARPTASLAWYYQVLGRGTRTHADKKDCLIIDFVGNVKKFGKIEDFYFKHVDNQWKLFGTGGRLLTGVPLHEIGIEMDGDQPGLITKPPILTFGKFKDKHIKDTPDWYRKWLLTNIEWNAKNMHLKNAILLLKENPKAFKEETTAIKCESSFGGKIKQPAFFAERKKPVDFILDPCDDLPF